ncbi:MAG: radical SAM family heme chaperone HemW [Thermacetogeniaceae bacterium]
MLALYLHIPFCRHKCHYCAFNSQPLPPGTAGGRLVRDYLDSLHRELELAAAAPAIRAPADGSSLHSIYFGGGTPTVLDPPALCSLLKSLKLHFHWSDDIEITVEANPATVDQARLTELRQAGCNRLSLGAQSFNALELQLLGRVHSVADIYAACRDARAAGFDNLSLDLIYGLPGQTTAAWRENLQQALGLCPEHLSAYGLKLEPGTPLAESVAAGRLAECDENEQLAMWSETQRLTSDAGLRRYEISNYARPGRESRHNLAYWRNEPYLALGAGAAGYVFQRSEAECQRPEKDLQNTDLMSEVMAPSLENGMVRYANYDQIETYMAAVDRGELPRAWEERETTLQERADTVMMGLRLTGGLDRAAFQARFGHSFEFFYGEQLAAMTGDGLMGASEQAVFLTERGLLLSNYVLSHFI